MTKQGANRLEAPHWAFVPRAIDATRPTRNIGGVTSLARPLGCARGDNKTGGSLRRSLGMGGDKPCAQRDTHDA